MKYSVTQSKFKIVLNVCVCGFLAVFIYLVIRDFEFGKDARLFIGGEVVAIVTGLVLEIFIIRMSLAFVTVNEQGVTRYIGNRVVNSAMWSEIDIIELSEISYKYVRMLYINVTFKADKSAAKARNTDIFILEKNTITIAYSKAAYNEIKKYYFDDIRNFELARSYDDNGKPI